MTTFRDISSRSAFASEIGWVSDLGYLRGWGDGTFRPLSTIKRDAMAVVFHRMAGSPDFTAPSRSPRSAQRLERRHVPPAGPDRPQCHLRAVLPRGRVSGVRRTGSLALP
ncbi:MAG: hypothetical protein DI634_08485 [Kocuria palustris]|nr:MAG: hypothetical protein DI634_08485 [Kocuria palustris]